MADQRLTRERRNAHMRIRETCRWWQACSDMEGFVGEQLERVERRD